MEGSGSQYTARPSPRRAEPGVLLTPDIGFATFADSPVASPRIAEAKLRAIVEAARIVRQG
jgi:methionine synthase II (cobalamin-independent)